MIVWLAQTDVITIEKSTMEWVVDWIGAVGAVATAFALIFVWLGWRSNRKQTEAMVAQLKEDERTRNMEVLLRMAERWDEDLLTRARRQIAQIPADEFPERFAREALTSSDDYFVYQRVANYFEDMGFLVEKQILQVDMVDEIIGNSVLRWWKLFGPAGELYDHARNSEVDNAEEENLRVKTYSSFGSLADAIADRRRQQERDRAAQRT